MKDSVAEWPKHTVSDGVCSWKMNGGSNPPGGHIFLIRFSRVCWPVEEIKKIIKKFPVNGSFLKEDADAAYLTLPKFVPSYQNNIYQYISELDILHRN